jgi:hypothetical protein
MKRILPDAQHCELQAGSTGGPIGPSVATLWISTFWAVVGRMPLATGAVCCGERMHSAVCRGEHTAVLKKGDNNKFRCTKRTKNRLSDLK